MPIRWTLRRLVLWAQETLHISCCRETIRRVLHQVGLSWKKAKKMLARGNPQKRQAFVEKLQSLVAQASEEGELLVFWDEAHIEQDVQLGYGWSVCGKKMYVSSMSSGPWNRVSLFGLYIYNESRVMLFAYATANGLNARDVLHKLRQQYPNRKIRIVWDGAPYHRSIAVKEAALYEEITLEPMSPYSPDLQPVEALWKWLREEVKYLKTYLVMSDMLKEIEAFAEGINQSPYQIADRLVVKLRLDPEEEKLLISS
jgi:transposase